MVVFQKVIKWKFKERIDDYVVSFLKLFLGFGLSQFGKNGNVEGPSFSAYLYMLKNFKIAPVYLEMVEKKGIN